MSTNKKLGGEVVIVPSNGYIDAMETDTKVTCFIHNGDIEALCPKCEDGYADTSMVKAEEGYAEVGVAYNAIEVKYEAFPDTEVKCEECGHTFVITCDEGAQIDSVVDELDNRTRRQAYSTAREWWE